MTDQEVVENSALGQAIKAKWPRLSDQVIIASVLVHSSIERMIHQLTAQVMNYYGSEANIVMPMVRELIEKTRTNGRG